MNSCNEEYAILWDFISSDKDLTYAEKILYSIILSLSMTEGYCWATNLQLMERMGISETNNHRFNDHMKALKNRGWIKIEGGTRDRKIYPLKKPIRGQNDPISNPVKKGIRGQNDPSIRGQNDSESPTPPYNDKVNSKLNIKHRGDWAAPNPSVQRDQKRATKTGLMSGPPPTPGPAEMVADTKDVLSGPHRLGSKTYVLSEEDWPWFYGFSPRIVTEALDRAHNESKKGTKISNIAAWLFAACARIKNE